MKLILPLLLGFSCIVSANRALAGDGRPFIGSAALLSTFEQGVTGTVTVVDAQTLRVDHFYFQGGGLEVYFRLGTNNSNTAFQYGLSIGNQLVPNRFTNASLTLPVPTGQSLEGYDAISVYCVDVNANFGSGAFADPSPPHLAALEQPDGSISVMLSGEVGKAYQLQSSSNLMDWVDFDLQTNIDGTTTFTDTNRFDQRFYRAVVTGAGSS